jgi:hypothetical protein
MKLKKFEDTKGVIRRRNRRRTDNIRAKRKSSKGQTTIYKTLHGKLKIDKHEPHKKKSEPACSGRDNSSNPTCDTRGVRQKRNIS